MYRYRHLITFLLLYTWPLLSSAQNQKLIDSLEKQLSSGRNDTVYVDMLNALAFEYRNYDEAKAFSLLDQSLKLSAALKYPAGAALAYNHLGILNKNLKKFDDALRYHQMALAARRQLGDTQGVASSYNNLGLTYDIKGDDKNAMKYLLASLRIRDAMQDTAGMSAVYNNISRIYAQQANIHLAKKYNLKAIQLRMATGDSFLVARYCGVQGFYYYEQNAYSQALGYFNRALRIYKTLGDKHETALLLNNIGNILAETGDMDEGIRHHMAAMKTQQYHNDTIGMFTSTLSLTQAYTFKKDYNQALKYGKLSRDLLSGTQSFVKMFMDYHEIMAELYRKLGNSDSAINALTEYNRFKDSLIKSQNNAAVLDMQMKYETEKNERELSEKNLALNKASNEIQKRNTVAGGLTLFIVLMALVGYLGYSRYKLQKQKEMDMALMRQQELRSKAVIEAEERERMRIAKDLHDGIGQQLSAIKIKASTLKYAATDEYEEQHRVLIEMVDDAVKEVRAISHDMMPNALLRLGLAAAIKEFIDKIAGTGMLKVDLQIIGLSERLDNTLETILYRVLQEAVSNIIKHANATKISIQLIKDENEISLVLEDNGKGFDTARIDSFTGIGLKNIVSRVEYLNGTAHFDSMPGAGTTVIIEVPLNTVASS